MNEESPEHRADLAAGFAPGSRLGGYRLEEQIGAGGMAVVFRARDERLDRLVALKIMTPAMGSDDMFRQRFIRESRAAAAVEDPHIIPVYDAGEVGQVLFIAMRLVRGGDVRSLLRREGPLAPDRVAAIISPVASALDAAHAVGLVHRDVKPANILLDQRPGRPEHVYLSDFGLSKSAEVSLGLTAAGQFLGTPDYTAPEQIEGLPVDGRTDQYALACAVFELLTGQAPFHRSESFAAIWAHLHKPPPSMTERRAELPAAVDAVMTRALAKAQVDRYPSCSEFAEALRDTLGLPPYRLGASSDPGLSRNWTISVPAVPRGAAGAPLAGLSPPPAAAGPGAAADAAFPPPGEDTEASELYAARPQATKRPPGPPAPQDEASAPDDQATDPGLRLNPADAPASPADSPASPGDSREEDPEQGPGGQRRPSGPPRNRPAPPGPPGHPPGVTRRGQRQGRRRATLLTLIGAGVLATAGAAVVLVMVLNTILVPAGGHHVLSPSDYSSAIGPPEVDGILTSIAFSPNGKALAVGASGGLKAGSHGNGVTFLLNVSSPTRIAQLTPGGGAEAFSPDGTMLATAGGPRNSATYVWDVATHRKIATLSDQARVESVSFSPKGTMLAVNDAAGGVYLWRLPHGARTTTVGTPASVSPPTTANSDALAFSPRGATLAMGESDGQAYLFNAVNHSYRNLSTPGNSAATSVAFSPDGAMLALSEEDGVTWVWNMASRRRISFEDPRSSGIESVAFSPNGKWLATGDANGNTYLWKLPSKNGKPDRTLTNPKSSGGAAKRAVSCVAFSPDSATIATTDSNGRAYLWPVP